MSATDITDEMIEQGRKAREGHYLRVSPVSCTCGWRSDTYIEADGLPRFEAHLVDLALTAVLPGVIRQAKAEALREAADQLDAYSPRDNPTPADPRWTCDLGYYGEAAWLRVRADRIEQGGRP